MLSVTKGANLAGQGRGSEKVPRGSSQSDTLKDELARSWGRGVNDCQSWGDSAWCSQGTEFQDSWGVEQGRSSSERRDFGGSSILSYLRSCSGLHPKISGKQGSDTVVSMLKDDSLHCRNDLGEERGWQQGQVQGMVRDSESLDSCFICWNGGQDVSRSYETMMSWEDTSGPEL